MSDDEISKPSHWDLYFPGEEFPDSNDPRLRLVRAFQHDYFLPRKDEIKNILTVSI